MLMGEPKWWKLLLHNIWLILPILTLLGILGGIIVREIFDSSHLEREKPTLEVKRQEKN